MREKTDILRDRFAKHTSTSHTISHAMDMVVSRILIARQEQRRLQLRGLSAATNIAASFHSVV